MFEIHCAPPNCPTSSLLLSFLPLRKLMVGGDVAHEWFSLIESLENGDSPAQGTVPLPGVKQSLKFLNVPHRPIIDSSFISLIQPFLNLVHLAVDPLCINQDNHSEGKCVFILNDNNITKLAVALPQLVVLFLGHVLETPVPQLSTTSSIFPSAASGYCSWRFTSTWQT